MKEISGVINKLDTVGHGENPIGKIINDNTFLGKIDTGSGMRDFYVLRRDEAFEICEAIVRHFIKCYGHDDLLPTPHGVDKLIEQFKNGEILP